MSVQIGGDKAWREFRKGDIVVVLQWVELPSDIEGEPPSPQPCMILRAARRTERRGCWAVPLGSLWAYREPKMMVKKALAAAEQIGLGGTTMAAHKVIDAIVEYAEDLKNMPPAPLDVRKVIPMGEAKLYANGRLISERLVGVNGALQ